MIKFLIVDDHFVVRQGLRLILREQFPDSEFGEASDGSGALSCVLEQDWNIVLLDMSMPGRGGLEALKDIKAHRPELPVIVLSMHPEDQFSIRVLKHGAAAYIRKDSAGLELVNAVTTALGGRRYITASLAQTLAENVAQGENGPAHEQLSDREYQVMCLLAGGKTVKEIAADLKLSVKTISTYRARILDKLKLKNNAQIMRYFIDQGLTPRMTVQ
jgi:DNA-binding NarL/FixJ family response regulator